MLVFAAFVVSQLNTFGALQQIVVETIPFHNNSWYMQYADTVVPIDAGRHLEHSTRLMLISIDNDAEKLCEAFNKMQEERSDEDSLAKSRFTIYTKNQSDPDDYVALNVTHKHYCTVDEGIDDNRTYPYIVINNTGQKIYSTLADNDFKNGFPYFSSIDVSDWIADHNISIKERSYKLSAMHQEYDLNPLCALPERFNLRSALIQYQYYMDSKYQAGVSDEHNIL